MPSRLDLPVRHTGHGKKGRWSLAGSSTGTFPFSCIGFADNSSIAERETIYQIWKTVLAVQRLCRAEARFTKAGARHETRRSL
jgi:hypothetical protein